MKLLLSFFIIVSLVDANLRPLIYKDGQSLDLPISAWNDYEYMNGEKLVQYYEVQGAEKIGLVYFQNFMTSEEVDDAISLCDKRNGWTKSPSRDESDGPSTSLKRTRTSYSCPLIWPLLYLPKMDILRESGKLTKNIEDEITFSWRLQQRVSHLLNSEETFIEPLQIVRYESGQFYRKHHDHGAYYGVKTEKRPQTLLVFLSSMPEGDGGGHTAFPDLGFKILPRKGDAILWNNVDLESEELIPEAVHEAVAPNGDVQKYAMNVWITQEPIQNINAAAYRTKTVATNGESDNDNCGAVDDKN